MTTDTIIHILRYLLGFFIGIFLSQMVDLGVPFWSVLLSIFSGLALSSIVLNKKVAIGRLLGIHLAVFVLFELLFFLINHVISFSDHTKFLDLYPGIIHSQIQLCMVIYLLSFIENYAFWTKANTLFFEIFISGFALLVFLSGHREYRIDVPSAVSSLTWKLPFLQRLKIEPQELLISLALFFSILSILYTVIAVHRGIRNRGTISIRKGKPSLLGTTILSLFILGAFIFISKLILERYNSELFQVMNGVGPSSNLQDGESNLGFNEASNPSNQPAALLRLLNSYDENPWEGMLYLREGALSSFAGKEMVKGPSGFDTDAPFINPGELTKIEPLGSSSLRTPVKQAVYMLSEKISPFAIDAPITFIPIKNPNPHRFRFAYTVQSLALAEPIPELLDVEVGDPSWSKEVWEHYLRAPGSNDMHEISLMEEALFENEDAVLSGNNEDLRYLSLAQSLTRGINNPMKKVFKIIEYLSRESVYVLKPGHQLGPRGDPVAPYLFAKRKRGYCVHYAHAAAYLFRLAKIPARIGTGFLVDLQYAKGGDILVQMGDRHAWPEVYIRDRGWIAIDVNPAEAENDQVAIPDESLLEQLMSEIDPIEELLGSDPKLENLKEKKSPIEEILSSPFFTTYPWYLLLTMLSLSLLIKLLLRHSWRLTMDPQKRIYRAYLSMISTLDDLGKGRHFGETRMEHARRLEEEKIFFPLALTKAFFDTSFGTATVKRDDASVLLAYHHRKYLRPVTNKLIYLLSYLNPVSLKHVRKLIFKGLFKAHSVILVSILLSSQVQAIPGIEHESSYDHTLNPESFNDHDAEKLLQEGISLYESGRGIDARAKFEQLLALRPNDYQPYFHLGQYYLADVGHFKLAYRYLKKARELFESTHTIMGAEFINDFMLQNQYSLILYLVAESALNLDFYEESLAVLDEYEALYQSGWYPGQRAWVLMKLKRVEEAITVAKQGLLQGADPKRTWNILGILLSISGQRELSIEAFSRAVDYEFTMRGNSQAATPLNNAGEVYRELFEDAFAESAWRTALRLPDGCEHVLPSINLSILYTDQLRIFQANQVLNDFEACYARRPERRDTEHRTILALARGKLKLFMNEPEEAISLLERSSSDQQWFGKIGTNENDVKFASWVTLAQAHTLQAEALLDSSTDSILSSLKNKALSYQHRFISWWLHRKAKLFSVKELNDFEDLTIRHTDTMITYPLLGSLIAHFDKTSIERRINRLIENDSREKAGSYYKHYLARNYFNNGKLNQARTLVNDIHTSFLPHEKLIQAENKTLYILSSLKDTYWWNKKEKTLSLSSEIESLFRLSPVHLRWYNIALPIQLEISQDIPETEKKKITTALLDRRFLLSPETKNNFKVVVSLGSDQQRYIQLYDIEKNQKIVSKGFKDDTSNAINAFIQESFSHKEDPVSPIPPTVPFMKKYGSF
jgi:tetratricopeptide (TPR) repeat protein